MIPFGNHFCYNQSDYQKKAKPLRAASAKRVSHRAFFSGELCGSMTVEASLVLPLFLFFMAEILSVFDMIRLQSRFLQALHETGTQMSEYAFYTRYALSDLSDLSSGTEMESEDGSGWTNLFQGEEAASGLGISLILSETYVRRSVQNYLTSDYLDHTCLEGGASSISYLQCRIMNENDEIDLTADYRVKPFLPLFGFHGFSSQSRYVGHAWTGYRIGGENCSQDSSAEEEEMVYVARTGSVYHRSRSCTYLKPSTRLVSAGIVDDLRSSDGSRYYACEVCHPSKTGQVVIADYGNRYHSSSSCTAIHRDVSEVPLSQVQDIMRPCSKCGGNS